MPNETVISHNKRREIAPFYISRHLSLCYAVSALEGRTREVGPPCGGSLPVLPCGAVLIRLRLNTKQGRTSMKKGMALCARDSPFASGGFSGQRRGCGFAPG